MPRGRPSLAVRVLLLAMLLLGPLLVVISLGLLFLISNSVEKTLLLVSMVWLFSAILLAPAVLFRDSGSSDSSDGEGGGGGGGSPRKPAPPAPPRGGAPLPDAEQSKLRLRDHRPVRLHPVRARRPAREPVRAPVRALPHR